MGIGGGLASQNESSNPTKHTPTTHTTRVSCRFSKALTLPVLDPSTLPHPLTPSHQNCTPHPHPSPLASAPPPNAPAYRIPGECWQVGDAEEGGAEGLQGCQERKEIFFVNDYPSSVFRRVSMLISHTCTTSVWKLDNSSRELSAAPTLSPGLVLCTRHCLGGLVCVI